MESLRGTGRSVCAGQRRRRRMRWSEEIAALKDIRDPEREREREGNEGKALNERGGGYLFTWLLLEWSC